MKKAIITGISGQDGAYLAALLREKSYQVIGTSRTPGERSTFHRLDFLNIYSDVTIISCLKNCEEIIETYSPDEVYNLEGQSSVARSFSSPFETISSNGYSTLGWLEAIRTVNPAVKFYQASSSEIFGVTNSFSKDERSSYHPRSPYAVSKLFSHFTTVNYRESYNIFACCGILFNHESPLRGEQFVTQKIVKAAVDIENGDLDCLHVGNISAQRDWGHARDYVKGMYLMMQHDVAEDFVLATGKLHSVKDFIVEAFRETGIELDWEGEGVDAKAICLETGKVLVKVDPEFFRPADIGKSLGNPLKANNMLGWYTESDFQTVVQEMIKHQRKNKINKN